jgi:hypothetical protein
MTSCECNTGVAAAACDLCFDLAIQDYLENRGSDD